MKSKSIYICISPSPLLFLFFLLRKILKIRNRSNDISPWWRFCFSKLFWNSFFMVTKSFYICNLTFYWRSLV